MSSSSATPCPARPGWPTGGRNCSAPASRSTWTAYCVLGVNVLGSCYGSTGPRSINPHTGRPYGGDFPVVSIHDMVRAQAQLLDHLGIERLHAVVGGSIGGMQALAWAMHYPDRVPRCVAIGAAPLSAMGLALSHLQRQAIRNDPAWRGGHYPDEDPPGAGLALARALAMCSYKSAELFDERFGRRPNRNGEQPAPRPSRPLRRGRLPRLPGRDLHRPLRRQQLPGHLQGDGHLRAGPHPGKRRRCSAHSARVLLVGISSDWLFPAGDVKALAERMRAAGVRVRHAELLSSHGHDGFLANGDRLEPLVADALREEG